MICRALLQDLTDIVSVGTTRLSSGVCSRSDGCHADLRLAIGPLELQRDGLNNA